MAYLPPLSGPALKGGDVISLILVKVGYLAVGTFKPEALFTLVSGYVLSAVGKCVYYKVAVIRTPLAYCRLGLVSKLPQLRQSHKGALFKFPRIQRRAVSPHKPGN